MKGIQDCTTEELIEMLSEEFNLYLKGESEEDFLKNMQILLFYLKKRQNGYK
jgi:hypothetical protein